MSKMKRLGHKRGFTMIELLAVIIILGILSVISIAAVQSLIDEAERKYYVSQEDNMAAAARSFAEKNNSFLPKVSGQTARVKLKELTKSKYIEKVVDYQKNQCDGDNSYVEIFLYEDNYYYNSYLECPGYKTTLEENAKNFAISITYSGGVTDGTATITLKEPDEGIASYNYRIYMDQKLAFSSEQFDAHKTKEEIKKTISLEEYTPSVIKVMVTAVNAKGYSLTKSATQNYKDSSGEGKPICGNVIGESTEWTREDRTIQVECNDNPNGIGCAKDIFTHKFQTTKKKGNIKILDKNGNYELCEVDVYIDREAPKVQLNGYKMNSLGEKKDERVVGTITVNNIVKNGTFKVTQDLHNNWLNGKNYPNGIYLEAVYEDLSPIKTIEWKVNGKNLKSNHPNAKNYTVTLDHPNRESGSYIIRIPEEGYRYGVLTVTDSAGNKSTINVEIPFDKTSPTVPANGAIGAVSGGNYDVSTGIADGSVDTLSDVKEYYYCVRRDSVVPGNEDACFTTSRKYKRDCGKTYRAYSIAIDNAGNRSTVKNMGNASDAADSWSGWSNCTKDCGGGKQSRSNTCSLKGTETRACNTQACMPPIPDKYKGTCNLVGTTQYKIRGGWYSPYCGNKVYAYLHYCADDEGNLYIGEVAKRLSNYNMPGVGTTNKVRGSEFGCPKPPLAWYKINEPGY